MFYKVSPSGGSSSSGVSSLNAETGAVELVEGANITITPNMDGTIEIAAAGGGGASLNMIALELTGQQALSGGGPNTILFPTPQRIDAGFTYDTGTGIITCVETGVISVQFTTAQISAGSTYLYVNLEGTVVAEAGFETGNSNFNCQLTREYIAVTAGDELMLQISPANSVNLEPIIASGPSCWASVKYIEIA